MGVLSKTNQGDEKYVCPLVSERRYKRPFDFIVSCILVLLSVPAAIFIALLVKLTSPGPILFHQQRLGRGGTRFTLYKFRTMYENPDHTPHYEYFKQYLRGAPAPGQDIPVFKLWNDGRITPCGSFLRRLGLDELPQIINVLKGEMSLVGPRPPLAYEVQHYEERHLRRLALRPGITGLWQVRGRDLVTFEEMVDMDLEYIESHSFALDVKILFRTVPSLITTYLEHR